MIRPVLALTRAELRRWLRSPFVLIAVLLPAAGLAVLVVALSYAVGRQPVALVDNGNGPAADRLAHIISTSDGFFLVKRTVAQARADLGKQKVAAVVTIPPTFDADLAAGHARVDVLINNVDLDFSDDIRRSVTDAAVEMDAPALAELGEMGLPPGTVSGIPNPYRIDIAERDLRGADVDFMAYQLAPVVILLALTAGTCGIAITIARDRERGVTKLFGFTRLRRSGEALARLLTGTFVAFAGSAVMLAICGWLGIVQPPTGRWPLLAAILALTTLAAAALGVLIARMTQRLVTTVGVAINLTMVMFLLGGGFTTIAFLPGPVQAIARTLPTYYSIEAIREVMFYPRLTNTVLDMALLAVFAVAFLVIASVRTRRLRT